MQTGIKEARQTLPLLIKMAEDGESVVLTRRGRKVAEIVAYRDLSSAPLVSRKELRSRIRIAGEPLSRTVIAEREDRA
jgi:prevent-host-death family protein